jgi:prophage regulatory protein
MPSINIIKLSKVKNLTKLSSSTIYRLISEGRFPKQIKLAKRSSGWVEHDVAEYIDSCIKQRD